MSAFSALDAASASLFSTLTAMRRKRIFHPRGTAYRGTLTMTASAALPACQLFSHTEPLPIIARLSRGAGFPAPVPDILGVALRVPDMYGPGQHQDLLFCSSGVNPLARRLFIPAVGYYDRPYCTVLSYGIAGQAWLIALIPARDIFQVAIAHPTGPWQVVGQVTLGDSLPPEQSQALQFNPWNTGLDIEPRGLLQRLRRNTYRASQVARLPKER